MTQEIAQGGALLKCRDFLLNSVTNMDALLTFPQNFTLGNVGQIIDKQTRSISKASTFQTENHT